MVWLCRSPIPVGWRGVSYLFKLFLFAVASLRGRGGSTLWEGPDISPANTDFKTLMAPYCCMQYAALKKCEAAVPFPPGSGNKPHTEFCDVVSSGRGALQLYPASPALYTLGIQILKVVSRKSFSRPPTLAPSTSWGNTVPRDGQLDIHCYPFLVS